LKFKQDQDFDVRLTPLFTDGGHEADTVRDEELKGALWIVEPGRFRIYDANQDLDPL
jgi:hypothetical protein